MDISYKTLREKYFEALKNYGKFKFKRHLIIYIVVNILLIYVNLVYTPEYIWFIYPLLFWGLGLALHYVSIDYKAKKYVSMLDDCINEVLGENISIKKD